MKTKIITLAIIFLSLAVITNAQPLPPSDPSGNPVPIGSLMYFLPALFLGIGIWKLSKKKK